MARSLPDRADLPHQVVLLLSDGLAGDQQEVVRGAHGVLGAAVPLVGGCAGDDLKMSRTFQLYDDRVLTDSVVAAGIASDAPLGIGVRHGWRRVGEPMLVTSSTGNRVHTLDDRPALDAYLKRLGVTEPAQPGSGGAGAAGAHPSARPEPLERRGPGALHRRRRLRGTVAVLHRRGPARRPGVDHGGRCPVGARGHRCRVRRLPRRAGRTSSAGHDRLRLHRQARRPRRGGASGARSAGLPRWRRARRWRGSTPTARSPGHEVSAASTTRLSWSCRSAEMD